LTKRVAVAAWCPCRYGGRLRKRYPQSQFTDQPIADTRNSVGAIVAISADSREGVDALAAKAVEAGGSETYDPKDLGFMYSRAFRDLDGHHWEVVWMDQAAAQSGPPEH